MLPLRTTRPSRSSLLRRLAAVLLVVLLLLVLLGAVGPSAAWAQGGALPSIPVRGSAEDLARFEGEWWGVYEGEETGRRGTIVFRLAAVDEVARGGVLMLPRVVEGEEPRAPVFLPIHFVEVGAEFVRGVLVEYRDPDLDCLLETEFYGRLVPADTLRSNTLGGGAAKPGAPRIEGGFTARGTCIETIPQRGRWWVERRALPAESS